MPYPAPRKPSASGPRQLPVSKGCTSCTRWHTEDYEVVGLQTSVQRISQLAGKEAELAALNLWQVLLDTLREARENFFLAKYEWGYYHDNWSATFPSKFLKRLRTSSWIPVRDGALKPPAEVCFSQLAAAIQSHPSTTLQELLGFKPEVLQQLAAEAGIDPATLDLLKKHDISTARLIQMLQQTGMLANTASDILVSAVPTNPPNLGGSSGSNTGPAEADDISRDYSPTHDVNTPDQSEYSHQSSTPSSANRHPNINRPQDGEFVTYIYTQPDSQADCSADNEDEHNVELGQLGVDAVIEFERKAGRIPEPMPQTHPGLDIISKDGNGYVERYIEVKTPGSNWGQRGVSLSETQFSAAQTHENDYWLYVVDDVGKPTERIYRIQNPAGRTKYFVYNHGWRDLAEPDGP